MVGVFSIICHVFCLNVYNAFWQKHVDTYVRGFYYFASCSLEAIFK